MYWPLIVLLLFANRVYAETLAGTVVGIADGDTLTVLDGRKRRHRVSLAEIDAPERNQAFGTRSRQSLVDLCFRKAAQVEWQAKDRNSDYIGRVTCAGVDANAEQVRRGMAWVSPLSTKPGSPLYELEVYARIRGVGLWADPKATPPWEWRTPKAPH